MQEPIEHIYFDWLYFKLTDTHTHNYYDLLKILHTTEFIWTIKKDRHRAEDGLELRDDFMRQVNEEANSSWAEQPCSVLELLVSFSERASFLTDIPARQWFWEFMRNLKLDEYKRISCEDDGMIYDILYVFINRLYSPNGEGGLFPMKKTKRDQRHIELWYQFGEYLDELDLY